MKTRSEIDFNNFCCSIDCTGLECEACYAQKMHDAIVARDKANYKQGVVDALSIILDEYDDEQHAMIIQRDGLFAVAKSLGVDLVAAIKEERYKLAAKICGRTVEQLKAIDAEGPQCEGGLPVYECVLQDCEHLGYCHFKVGK